MNSRDKIAIKSGTWYVLAQFLIRGIGFITTPIFARIMTKEAYGNYSNYVAVMSILSIIITLKVSASLISAKKEFEKEFDEYVLSISVLSFVFIMISAIIIGIFSDFFSNITNIPVTYLYIMILEIAFSSAISIFQIKERYFFHYKVSVAISVFNALLTSLLSVTLVVFLENQFTARVIGAIIPLIISGTYAIVAMTRNVKKIKITYWKYAIPICLPFIPHLLSIYILNSMDKIMITKYCGPEENALYSLAYMCAGIVSILVSAINDAFAPWQGERLVERNFEKMKKVSRYYIRILVFLVIGGMLVAPEILLILGRKKIFGFQNGNYSNCIW